jgi:hypothetical protein
MGQVFFNFHGSVVLSIFAFLGTLFLLVTRRWRSARWLLRGALAHENSFLHRKTSFLLEPAGRTAANGALTP